MSEARASLTVATYNVRAGIGPGPFPPAWWEHSDPQRIAGMARVIADLDADVVALQEVALLNQHGVVQDQAAELGRGAGFDNVRYGAVGHFPIVDPDSGDLTGACFWGNAVLSRWPIVASRTVGLPIASDDDHVEPLESALELAGVRYADAPVGVRERRCLVTCDLDVDGRLLHVLATHLTHIGSGQHSLQTERIAAEVAALPGPVILLGDLNATISSTELRPLREALVDAFGAANVPPGDEARASCGPYPIDHILVRDLDPTSSRVVREAGDLSDHWPVLATLDLPPGAAPTA